MDELNMDSLDLPEMEHDYSDLPDASEGLDAPEQHTAPVLAAEDDLSDIEMPVLSEMDGSAPVQPVKAEAPKQAAPCRYPKWERLHQAVLPQTLRALVL